MGTHPHPHSLPAQLSSAQLNIAMRVPLSWVKKAVREGKGVAPRTTEEVGDAPRGHHHSGTQVHLLGGMSPTQHLPLGPGGQGGMGDHVTAQQAILRGQASRTEPLPPPGICPTSLLPLPCLLCLRERAGETEAAGASRLVMRQIYQTAATEGVLETLDPTLITCQPARPDATQKLWNKRAISYYF